MSRQRITSAHALVIAVTAAAVAPSACSSGGDTTGSGGAGGTSSHASSSHSSSGPASSSSSSGELPDSFTVSGVVTDGEAPVEGAMVMQGGGDPQMITGPDGAYSVTLGNTIPGTPTVVAAKIGYRAGGTELTSLPDGPVDIELRFVSAPDNPGYTFGDPGKGGPGGDPSTLYCGHCHSTLAAQFQTSAHAKATRDPLVQDLYAGVTEAFADQASCQAAGGKWRSGLVPGTASDAKAKCYLGGGVLPDLNPGCGAGATSCDDPALPAGQKPTAFGRCADCHAPGIDGPAGGRSLHDATGVAFENGNHCDPCHHIRDVDLTKPPGVGGALILQRPRDKVSDQPNAKLLQVMFGPLPDVVNGFMGGSYQPKFMTAELCGGCHEQKQEALIPGASLDSSRWPSGLPTHSTYSEWSDSSFNTPGTPCQFCHMPPDDTGLVNSVDVTQADDSGIVFGFPRPPERIRKHIFREPLEGSPRLIDQALSVSLSAVSDGAAITVTVHAQNTLAGHAIPTGEPMRALVLLVTADACGPLAPSGGMTLNDIGGAIAEGTVGAGVTVVGTMMTWAAGAGRAKVGDVVRVVRPTGTYDDYAGIGFFADPALSAAEKGLEIRSPVGEASVVSVQGGAIVLGAVIAAQAGDVVYLGDALVGAMGDGDPSRALAGRAGWSFARVLVDPQGNRQVPHHRAIDMASDNRIAPQDTAITTHVFPVPPGCSSGQIQATLVYRPVPVGEARLRGWDARDWVVGTAAQNLTLP